MKLERRHGWLLLAVAVWNVVVWLTFARNLYDAHAAGEDRPTGYWVAHSVLIVVDLGIAVVLGRLSWRLLRARPDDRGDGGAAAAPADRSASTDPR